MFKKNMAYNSFQRVKQVSNDDLGAQSRRFETSNASANVVICLLSLLFLLFVVCCFCPCCSFLFFFVLLCSSLFFFVLLCSSLFFFVVLCCSLLFFVVLLFCCLFFVVFVVFRFVVGFVVCSCLLVVVFVVVVVAAVAVVVAEVGGTRCTWPQNWSQDLRAAQAAEVRRKNTGHILLITVTNEVNVLEYRLPENHKYIYNYIIVQHNDNDNDIITLSFAVLQNFCRRFDCSVCQNFGYNGPICPFLAGGGQQRTSAVPRHSWRRPTSH